MLQFKIEFPDASYIIISPTDGGSVILIERFDGDDEKETETTISVEQFQDIQKLFYSRVGE